MTLSLIENLLCDYSDSLDVTQRHHTELLHCHGWKTAIAEEVLASIAAELVRMAQQLTSRDFVTALNATTETLELEPTDGGCGRWQSQRAG